MWALTSPSMVNGPEQDDPPMKMIQAIIRPERFDSVKIALEQQGFVALTAIEVKGQGEQKGITLEYRGKPVQIDLLPKMKIEIVVQDQDIAAVIEIIRATAHTGKLGDGKIFVMNVERMAKVRTDEEWT
jgi:nitrogen regulatory protein P-II 1